MLACIMLCLRGISILVMPLFLLSSNNKTGPYNGRGADVGDNLDIQAPTTKEGNCVIDTHCFEVQWVKHGLLLKPM